MSLAALLLEKVSEKMLKKRSSAMFTVKNVIFLTLISFFKQLFWARDYRYTFNLFIPAGGQAECRATWCIWLTTQPSGDGVCHDRN